jgi:hypothetical protein
MSQTNVTTNSGPTTIFVIRHAEKPDQYDGTAYGGVNPPATVCGAAAVEDLTTLGWQRTGGLNSLFGAPPFGPRKDLAVPDHLYAANPEEKKSGKTPSQRPFETLTALAAVLGKEGSPKKIVTQFSKNDYALMVTDVLTKSGVVLVCWQHEDIPLEAEGGKSGISQEILTQTNTKTQFPIPKTWPDSNGQARYDLIFVFTRNVISGEITAFDLLPQYLAAGDGPVQDIP